MSAPAFIIEQDGPIARLILNRPHKRNALNAPFWHDLPLAINALSQSGQTRVLIIEGKGPHFTAGLDLSMFGDMADAASGPNAREAFIHKLAHMQAGFDALENARFPVIAAVQGCCIGAGIDMISACDIRLATKDAYFRIEEINVGMAADVGTLQRLPKILADGVVRELAFTGDTLDAQRALTLGLVSALAEDTAAVSAMALEMAQRIAAKPPLAIAATKDALNHARDHGVAESLRYMRALQAGLFNTDDIMQALTARGAGKKADFEALADVRTREKT